MTDANGHKTLHCHNSHGRVLKSIDPQGHETSQTYSANGDPQAFTDGAGTAGAVTQLSYDFTGDNPTNNPTGATAGAGEAFSLDYTHAPGAQNPWKRYQATKATDPQGRDTLYDYDNFGNLSSVRSGQSSVNSATLVNNVGGDPADTGPRGTLRMATDGRGKSTSFGYDAKGNLILITPPLPLGDTNLSYDSLSRVRTVQDGKNRTRTVSYDGFDRPTRVNFSDGSWVAYDYDAGGNLLARTDSRGRSTLYTYDALNRRTREAFPGGVQNTYAYHAGGELRSLTDAGGETLYAYDSLGRIKTLTLPTAAGSTLAERQITYVYEARTATYPRRATVTYPGGIAQRTSYDRSDKPTEIRTRDSAAATLGRFVYAYKDPADASRETQLRQSLSYEWGADKTTNYAYDELNRLKQARTTVKATGALVDDYQWEFDAASNCKFEKKTTSAGATQTNYAYNDANQLCRRAIDAPADSCPSPATYTYDANGNETRNGAGRTRAYDERDNTTSLAGTALDFLGPTQVELSEVGSTDYKRNLLGIGSKTASAASTYYFRDPAGRLVAQRSGSSVQFALFDALGSTTGLVERSQNVVRSYLYDPDGEHTTSGSGAQTDFRYTGSLLLPDGLYHNGRRFYDPSVGRWTQQDPLNQIADLREANRYVYVGCDPVKFTDPTGLRRGDDFLLGVEVGAVVAGVGCGVAGAVTGGVGFVACGIIASHVGGIATTVNVARRIGGR